MSKSFKNYYKLIIPVNPDSINKVVKYGKREGDVVVLKRKWESLAVNYILKAQQDGELPEEFLGKIGVHFKLIFDTERERDGDNYTLMCKGILDAFTKLRMIRDDNYKYVDDNGRRFQVEPERGRVEIYITEKILDRQIVEIKYE